MEIYFDQKEIGFDKVYDRYRKDEFYSPFRSTVPLLDLIKNGKEMLKGIVNELGVVGKPIYRLEYRVCSPKRKNSISQTDLWVETESHVLGIEAKWTERRYMKVGKWLQEGSNPDNREAVLEGWLDKLYCPSTPHPGNDEMRDQIYQMVHRAASVYGCDDDQNRNRSPILAYVQFTEELQLKKKSYIHQDLSSLWSILGKPEKFPFYYVQVLIERNEAFKHIEHLEKRSVETGKKVKEALSGNEPLFTYKDKKIVKIGEA